METSTEKAEVVRKNKNNFIIMVNKMFKNQCEFCHFLHYYRRTMFIERC